MSFSTFSELLTQARSYLKQEWEEGRRFVYSVKTPIIPQPTLPKKTVSKQKKAVEKKMSPSFSLEPLPPLEERSLEEMQRGIKEAHPDIHLSPPSFPILIALYEEAPTHRALLEKVAAAITKTIAPARVILIEERLPLPSCKLLIAPLEGEPPHALITQNHQHILTLAPLDHYLNDQSLKRALWNKLKTLSLQKLS